ncbi:MAG: hypothetical protein H6905_01460 [Hyphomicrobiales bacterium]|nr:hypothetical protein [Hyphomicrobiales bacterium]
MSAWTSLMRQAAVICALLAVALAVVLMTVKQEVQALEEELAQLNQQVVAERQAVKVLKAEFSLLSGPDRLRQLAEVHLGLRPIEPEQLSTISDLGQQPAEPGLSPRMTGGAQFFQHVRELGGVQ